MRVFIDTNIYVRLFEGAPSVGYFDKLEELIKTDNKKFTLVFPRITREEVFRRVTKILVKETRVPDSKKLKFRDKPKAFDKSSIKKLKEIETEYRRVWDSAHQEIVKKDLKIKRKMAKKLFGSILSLTVDFPVSKALLKKAEKRLIKRYSPGKSQDPLGDQVVWELLLKNCIDDELVIVSDDKDWQDTIRGKNLNPFLLEEWKSVSNKKIGVDKNMEDLIRRFEKDYRPSKEEAKKKDIEQEKEEIGRQSIIDYYTAPVSPASIAGSFLPVVGSASIGTQPIGTAPLGGDLLSEYIPQCSECGNVIDYPNVYLLCLACRNKRGLP